MKTMPGIIVIFACCMLWATGTFAAPNIQDGLWEVTTTVEMAGMPEGMMHPMKHTACLTRKNAVPAAPAKSDCKITDINTEGNSVSWTMNCPNAVSKGKVTYSGTTFNGATETTMNQGGRKMQVKNKMEGRRIGPCK